MHYIFLVHGMGNWDGEWPARAKEIVRRHYDQERYGFLGARSPFDEHFQFEPIGYNHLFERYLDEAEAQADRLGQWSALNRVLEGGLLEILSRIVNLAKTSPDRNNSHRGSSTARRR